MRYHHRLPLTMNVGPLALALFRQPDLWNAHRFRTTFPGTPFEGCDDIWLRFNDIEGTGAVCPNASKSEIKWFPAIERLPEVRPIVMDLMRATNAYQLDRCLITRLKPGAVILPHADNAGDYVHEAGRIRFHVVVQGLPGSLYTTADETVCMRTGEVWTFNAHEVHSVHNNSTDDRIHLLVDVKTWP